MLRKVSHIPGIAARRKRAILLAGIAGFLSYALARDGSRKITPPYAPAMLQASDTTDRALKVLAARFASAKIEIDAAIDPNRTALIGREADDLTTSIGHLEAKRTSTNPNFAGLVVHMLTEAGATQGDTVAIGCSGSFPALLIASMAAAQALHLRPVVILSLGASSFGATRTDFNLLHMYRLLQSEAVFEAPPAAVSLGGEDDVGSGFEADLRDRLIRQVADEGLPLVAEADLRANVSRRMAIYAAAARERGIAAFINIGGAYANLGTSPMVLDLKPGLNWSAALPPENQRGVIFEMVARGIPVVHLLYIKGLASKYGLPWDPIPLPRPGDWQMTGAEAQPTALFWTAAVLYLAFLALLALAGGHGKSRKLHSH
jgi:poly-gamma-glutamate system protein